MAKKDKDNDTGETVGSISDRAGSGNALVKAGAFSVAPKQFDLSKAVAVRKVATPQLSIKPVVTKDPVTGAKTEQPVRLLVKIVSAIAKGEDRQQEDGKTMKGAFSMRVIDLTDGKEKALVTPVIMRSLLNSAYPENGYIGKCFAMEKGETRTDKAVGRQFNEWDVIEIDVPEVAAE